MWLLHVFVIVDVDLAVAVVAAVVVLHLVADVVSVELPRSSGKFNSSWSC